MGTVHTATASDAHLPSRTCARMVSGRRVQRGPMDARSRSVKTMRPIAIDYPKQTVGRTGNLRTDKVTTTQNTTARRIGWVESNVLSNTFNNSLVKWCPSFLMCRKRESSRFDFSSVSKCRLSVESSRTDRKRL